MRVPKRRLRVESCALMSQARWIRLVAPRPLVAAVVALLSLGTPVVSPAADLQLPNLVPKVPSSIQIGKPDQVPAGEPIPQRALRFATTSYNLGRYSLELRGESYPVIEEPREEARPFRQCVRFVRPACTEWRVVGAAVYHVHHNHWHLDEYAGYELLPVTGEGLPDFDAEPVVPGVKASFCLVETERAPGYVYDDTWGRLMYEEPVISGCGLDRQGISPGWGDTYGPGLFGQQIVLDGLSAGMYALVITVNYTGRLYETTREDNRSWVVLNIGDCDEVEVLRSGVG